MCVKRGEFNGKPMIYIYNSKEDAEAAASGVRVRSAFQCGVKKAEHILNHLPEIADFVADEGEINPDTLDAIELLRKKK
jgi:hypothetical protein